MRGLAAATALLLVPRAAVAAGPCDDLAALQSRFQTVADRVAPSTVAIAAIYKAELSPSTGRSAEMNGDRLAAILARQTHAVGTGFFVSADGYVLTNDHVIDDAEQIWVTTDDGRVYPAMVVGSDPRSDLAVLKTPLTHARPVSFADPATVRRGEWALAIGNPYGLSAGGSMCLGIGVVSALDRSLPRLSETENRLYSDLIQTTATINPGNSGGPLVDLDGRVMGLTTAVILPSKWTGPDASAVGIGFAVPADARLQRTVRKLERGEPPVYGYLGVCTATATGDDCDQAGMAVPVGVIVRSVTAGSPADHVLRDDDVLVAIDHAPVHDTESFARAVGDAPVGPAVPVIFYRCGERRSAEVRLVERPLPTEPVTRRTRRLRWAGLTLGPTSAGDGVCVLAVDRASPFARPGLVEGALLRSVGKTPVTTLESLQIAVEQTPIPGCDLEFDKPSATATSLATIDDR